VFLVVSLARMVLAGCRTRTTDRPTTRICRVRGIRLVPRSSGRWE
jgi:hypothetical protein